MSSDAEQQEDELLALHSIFGSDEFFRDESKSAGEIHVSVELPAGFCVSLREGESLRQYEMSSLPPLLLTFELSEHYPSSSPPTFSLTCSWLSHTQLSALCAQLADLYQDAGGAVVLFTWIQFLKEEALSFLDIHTGLELPSDDPSTQSCSPDPLQAAVSRPEHPPHSGPADAQRAESWPNLDDQKNCNDSNPASHPSDVSEAAAGGGSAPRPAVQSSGDEESDSGPAAGSEQGATSVLISPGESLETQDQTLSGLSLTPSQTLLSQLLLHDADQKQRRFATTVFDCGVCFMSFLGSECVEVVECGHIFCRACLAQFCKLQITEGNVRGVTCLQADCTAAPTPAQVRSLVGEELFSRYDRLLLQITLDCMSDVVYCPRQSCGSAVILESDNAAVCPMCRFAFCVRCKKTYHGADACQKERANGLTELDVAELPPSVEGIRALFKDYKMGSKQRRQLLESRYGRWLFRGGMKDFVNSENWVAVNTKKCPHCFSKIEKEEGCNVMTCSRCLQKFCWACLTRLTASDVYHHFSSCPLYS